MTKRISITLALILVAIVYFGIKLTADPYVGHCYGQPPVLVVNVDSYNSQTELYNVVVILGPYKFKTTASREELAQTANEMPEVSCEALN